MLIFQAISTLFATLPDLCLTKYTREHSRSNLGQIQSHELAQIQSLLRFLQSLLTFPQHRSRSFNFGTFSKKYQNTQSSHFRFRGIFFAWSLIIIDRLQDCAMLIYDKIVKMERMLGYDKIWSLISPGVLQCIAMLRETNCKFHSSLYCRLQNIEIH